MDFIKEIKKEEFKNYKNGVYLFNYDPEIVWEFWTPGDEEVIFYNGRSRSAKLGIEVANHIHCNVTFLRNFSELEERLISDFFEQLDLRREQRCTCSK